MKARLKTIVGILAGGIIALSAPKYAAAQTEEDQPAASQQDDQYNDQGSSVEDQQDVDFNTFYDALSPYGSWQDDPNYGQVWVCNEADFSPYYSNGNWQYSDAGWAWVSNYNWGWAPFHYGRWAYHNRWMWVPGYQWAPAWVSWRTGGEYYGWAPLSPGISIGVGAGYGGYIAAERWNFCPRAYITHGSFNRYCIDRRRNITVIRNTTIINHVNVYHNTRFVAGPERREVERFTNTRIRTMSIHNTGRPGATVVNGRSIQMYRPNIKPGNNTRLQAQRNNPQQPNINRQQPNRPQIQQRYQPQQNKPQAPQQNRQPVQQPARPQQTTPAPNRPTQQPGNIPQRQAIRNTDRQQNALNHNNRAKAAPDKRMALNNRQAQPAQQNRPQAQQQRLPQQQVRQQHTQITRQQAQQPRQQAQPQQHNAGKDRTARKG